MLGILELMRIKLPAIKKMCFSFSVVMRELEMRTLEEKNTLTRGKTGEALNH